MSVMKWWVAILLGGDIVDYNDWYEVVARWRFSWVVILRVVMIFMKWQVAILLVTFTS